MCMLGAQAGQDDDAPVGGPTHHEPSVEDLHEVPTRPAIRIQPRASAEPAISSSLPSEARDRRRE